VGALLRRVHSTPSEQPLRQLISALKFKEKMTFCLAPDRPAQAFFAEPKLFDGSSLPPWKKRPAEEVACDWRRSCAVFCRFDELQNGFR
jgi:hypothetical protein